MIFDFDFGLIASIRLLLECVIKDDDNCLQTSPAWSRTYTCKSSTRYCKTWPKDMKRCCPEACNTGKFTEVDCKFAKGSGTCIYPNDAQCGKVGESTGSPKPISSKSSYLFMLKIMIINFVTVDLVDSEYVIKFRDNFRSMQT